MWLNPALSQLHRAQSYAKLRRLAERLRSPRRFVLSVLAVILAVVWLGNAAISILLRQPYSIETLRHWVPMVLMAYALWHVVKVAWQRPEVPIEWSPAENEIVTGGPFSRREVLAYRLTAVMSSGLLKALCASLLLAPDFPVWIAGFLGVVLALAFLELLRMVSEIATYYAPPRAYRWFRVGMIGVIGTMAVCALATTVGGPSAAGSVESASTIDLLRRLFLAVTELRHTWLGRLWEAPFTAFTHVILAPSVFRVEFAGWLILSSALVVSLGRLVFWFDRAGYAARVRSEQEHYRPLPSANDNPSRENRPANFRLPRAPRLGGAGPFVWRQMIGAFGHRTGLLMALLPPTVLALLPLAVPLSPAASFLQVTGGLVFYSFLLLPAALKFDFRRDYDRLYAFKMLPTSPSAVVVGQLATPILLTSGFQFVALAVAVVVRPVPASFVLSTVVLLLPLNVLIFSFENLFFLLSPYRLSQEGIDVFLRSILVFTAKGAFFALALACFLAWAVASRAVSGRLASGLGIPLPHGMLFLLGAGAVIVLTSVLGLRLVVRAYQRFDPTLDLVG